SSRAPVIGLGRTRAFCGSEKPKKLPVAKLALKRLPTAVGFRKPLLLFLFEASPVWMSAPAINLRHLCVQTSHRWHLLQRATVQIESARKLLLAESSLRHQRLPVRGVWRR